MKSTIGARRLDSGELRGARARLGRITLSLALAAASLSITGIGLASPADAAGTPLSCDGGTIYSYQRGTTGSDRTTTGSVYALNTSTVGGATVAATLVTRVPSGGFANALGITTGGTAMYAVNQFDIGTEFGSHSRGQHQYAA